MLTHKEMTAHIRKRLRVAKINARVKMDTHCGGRKIISVVTPKYDKRFTSDELRTIAAVCETNHLTAAQRSPIDPDLYAQLVGSTQFNFEFHEDRNEPVATSGDFSWLKPDPHWI